MQFVKKYKLLNPILIILLLLATFSSYSQTNNLVSIGTKDSIHSNLLKQNRQLLIYTPESMLTDTSLRYPVVYLLDGEMYFHSFTGIVNQLQGSYIPEMIVVGIVNIERNLDYTPTTDTTSGFKPNGGGEAFTDFLAKELFPFVEKHYPVAPYRMLVGHSFGGLLSANTLLKHTELFNSYLILDPGLWWDNMKLIKQSKAILSLQKFENKRMYLSMSNSMPAGMKEVKNALKDTTPATNGIRSIIKFTDILEKSKPANFSWKFKYYENENHTSIPLISSYDGLKFIFDFYKRPSFASVTDSTASILENHFKKISEKMGFTILPPANDISGMAYRCMVLDKNFDRAFIFLQMYLRLYPSSPYPYYEMGKFYEAKGDLKKANEYYEQVNLHLPK